MIRYSDGCYGFEPKLRLEIDLQELLSAAGQARRASARGDRESAVRCHRAVERLHDGRVLMEAVDSAWADELRRVVGAAYCDALRTLAQDAEAQGDSAASLRRWERLADVEVYDEEAYRVAARLNVALGHPHRAKELLERCRAAVVDDLGVALADETVELGRQLSVA